jgi:hypothetical protein
VHKSAASETRLLLPPVTVTTGVWPRWAQVRPLGDLKPWPDSSSKTIRAPRSAVVLLPLARPPPASRQSGLHPAPQPAARDLDAPADPVQQVSLHFARRNHPETLWELAWLHQLWAQAYLAEQTAPKDTAGRHDR